MMERRASLSDCKFIHVNDETDAQKFGITAALLNPLLVSVVCALDPFFEASGVVAIVTSGVRTAEKQLSLIIQKALKHGLDAAYPNIKSATVENVDSWKDPWGKLLCLGEMINPPVKAMAPFDYTRSDGSPRKAGNMIDISNHMKEHSEDLSTPHPQQMTEYFVGHPMPSLEQVRKVIAGAIASGVVPELKDYLMEPTNGAVHLDCVDAKLNTF